jgi:hypothetical protein
VGRSSTTKLITRVAASTSKKVFDASSVLPDQLVVLAIAHTSKKPGYWRERIEK